MNLIQTLIYFAVMFLAIWTLFVFFVNLLPYIKDKLRKRRVRKEEYSMSMMIEKFMKEEIKSHLDRREAITNTELSLGDNIIAAAVNSGRLPINNEEGASTFTLISYPNGEDVSNFADEIETNVKPEIWIEKKEPTSFRINKYIELKLESERTNIYVNGVHFRHCTYLLINIDKRNLEEYEEINDINEVFDSYGTDLEDKHQKEYEITPEEIFKGHCSNIQVWVENDYDTRILDNNLSFPLLKRLVDVGDEKAINMFRDEILNRYYNGNDTVRSFLILENYLDYLEIEQILDIIKIELKTKKALTIVIELKEWNKKLNLNAPNED